MFVDRLRGWNLKRITRRRLLKPAIDTPFGFRINAIKSMQDGSFEPQEVALVRTLLKNMDRFVNVGANMGFYCLLANSMNVPTIGLEPVSTNIEFIIRNIEENQAKNVTILPVAAGEDPGFVDIFGLGTGSSILPHWGNNPRSTRQRVPTVRLDDVCCMRSQNERLLVLMDIEGYEYFALKGATVLLSAPVKPVWIIEVVGEGFGSTRNPDADNVFALMKDAGYQAVVADATLAPAMGPSRTATNFMFFDSKLDLDEVLGPCTDRTAPLI